MALITKPYSLQCKNSVGGVKKIWLTSYSKIQRSRISIVENELISFPEVIVYEFQGLYNSNFTENISISDSGTSYDQTLNITFSKIGSVYDFESLVKNYTRAIVLDNNNIYHYLGLYNGLVGSFSKQTGTTKQELNGYTLTLTGKETIEAPYSKSLVGFTPTARNSYSYIYPVYF
jgi:hypothetical protein